MSRQSHPFQMGLHGFTGDLWLPNAAGDGASGLGSAWEPLGTLTQPTPTNTDIGTVLKRTRFANVITTLNQPLGVRKVHASDFRFWRGGTSGLGGFYFSAIFGVEKWRDNTGRLFVGLASSAAGDVAVSDAPAGDFVGLWHKSTDGANVLSIARQGNGAIGEDALTGTGGSAAPTLAAGQVYRWEMWAESFAGYVGYRLSSISASTKLWVKNSQGEFSAGSESKPRSTILMAPYCRMNNGGTIPAADDFAISVANILVTAEPTLT